VFPVTVRAGVAAVVVVGALLAAFAASANERAMVVRPAIPVPPDAFPIATDARLAGDGSRTRLVIDLSRTIEVTAFTLADPYRIIVDLPQITFQLPGRTGEKGRGLVRAFRYGLVMQGGSRLVIDASGPVRIEKAFVLDAVDADPARLVLDLVATDRESFMRNLAVEGKQRRTAEPRRNDAKPSGDARPLVMIDAGHGGVDSGATAPTGEMEKNIVLEFALALREKLEKTGKYRVAMTRQDDTFIPLADRVRISRASGASLFVSIHADAITHNTQEVRGATVFTLSESASDAEAARLADSENRADVIAGVDLSAEPEEVADILVDLTQRETKNFSNHFARTVVAELKAAARLSKNPIKSAGFRVLKAPDVPSVLIELGYVTNKDDLKLITSEQWRGRTADAIAQAINTFFSTRIAGSAPAPGQN
jgi:N-acetylmuramoyl-L-alanine amidase